jgi:two-component system LytT family sensor kinase
LTFSLPGYFAAKAGNVTIEPLKGFLSIVLILAPVLYFNLFGFLLKTFIEWIEDRKIKAELEKDKLVSQLELLKSKINPHFLFNTINNIDVLIQIDPIKASDYLNKLSDIMRFMLYETKAAKILLSNELTYIEKYIDLQKIRTSNMSYVNYGVTGDPGNLKISPMLFIPFIENAFKHAENKNLENAINIQFTILKEMIIFDCENKFTTNNENILEHSGLGNDLIEKRLILLYPDNHQLTVTSENNTYKVNLTLTNAH